VSAILTVTLLAFLMGVLFCYGTYWVAKEVLELNLDDEDMIEIVMDDPDLEEAPPPPPPPPPPPAAAAQEEEPEEPDPEEMVEDVKELDKPIDDKVANAKADPVPSGGDADGVEGGVEGGVVGGVVGGVLKGPRTFHHTELRKKRQVQPEYPEAARTMNLGDVSCKVRMFIDEKGLPYNIKFEACPKIFQASAQNALMRWRFYSAKDENGTKVKAQFLLNIKYKLTG